MFSGKTAQLILRVSQTLAIGQKARVYKPRADTRCPPLEVRSQDGLSIEAVSVDAAQDILWELEPDTRTVAIDETQFLDPGLVQVCEALAREGKRVIVAGLDTDFRGEPFGPIPQILAVAESVDKLKALCSVCGRPASFSQRLVDGEAAPYSAQLVRIGSTELYQARCRAHHLVPGKAHRRPCHVHEPTQLRAPSLVGWSTTSQPSP